MKICMLVKNSFEYDARVAREARTLIGAGHEVTIVALLARGVTPEKEVTPYGATVIRVPRVELGVGRFLHWAGRRAEHAVRRDAEARGVEPDEEALREARTTVVASTAVPGSGAVEPSTRPEVVGGRPGASRLRARLALSLVTASRAAARLLRSVLGPPTRLIRGLVLDRRMRAAALGTGPNVFHAHDLNTLRAARSCARGTGARLVYDAHELAADRSRMTAKGRWWARVTERRWLRSADALVVASPVWLEIMAERYGTLPRLTASVLNTPEAQTVDPIDIRPEIGLEPGTPLLLYQGSIQEHRGIEAAIDAITGLEGVAFAVVGYGHHRPVLEREVRERGLADRVRFFGPVPTDLLLRYTASADAGLCTIVSSSLSYHTSLPNKLFEYFMAGVPVLGSEAPEIARVISETGAGVTVPATDADAVAAGLKRLLADPRPYREAAAAAAETYHWAVEGEKLLALYSSLEAA